MTKINIRFLWILMLSISVVLFLFQASVDAIAPSGGTTIYDEDGTILSEYNSGTNGSYDLIIDPDTGMPELPADITTESGDSGFTDIFQSIRTWFQNTAGGKIIGGLYYAVPNILKGLGMPEAFSYALGLLWSMLAIFSFVMFMRGVQ